MRWSDLSIWAPLLALCLLAAVACRSSGAAPGGPAPSATPPPSAAAAVRSPATLPSVGSRAVPPSPPADDAPLETIRSFVAARPDHSRAARLRQLHDQRLLPCPGGGARCEPRALIVAQGALDRARAYPGSCLDCRDRVGVEQLATRLAAVVRDLETRDARERFEQAMGRDLVEAEQVLADAGSAYDNWRAHARRRLDRRLQQLGGQPLDPDPECHVPPSVAALISPERPTVATPVRVLLASTEATDTDSVLTLEREDGSRIDWTSRRTTDEGLPVWWLGSTSALEAGRYRAVLRREDRVIACQRLRVRKSSAVRPDDAVGAWTTHQGWSPTFEALYSVWLRILVDAPEAKHWHGLFELTRDPDRNLLHNHLGLDEDTPRGLVSYELEPDCADGPYFLRAYFAWKLGLPFGWHECRYGRRSASPKCGNWTTNESWKSARGADEPPSEADESPADPSRDRLERMTEFLGDLKEQVMARSLRTRLDDEQTDLYPVALSRSGLRPGVLFADPYGHTLTLARWVPQRENETGKLLSVDAQPDGTLAIKRFWRGNFVFVDKRGLGGHGFKAFRPIVVVEGKVQLLNSHQIGVARGYGQHSLEQMKMSAPEFYARVQRLINPTPLDPEAEYRALHEALLQLLRSRVQSVAVAQEYHAESNGKVIGMPEGRAIFATTGPWEAYSTPCRDLRLLVGIDHLLAYPKEASAGPGGTGNPTREARLLELHRRWATELTFDYVRSDGSKQTLTIGDVIARRKALEMGYNPNDCPEIRWAAPTGSDEQASCTHRAPESQRRRMEQFRHWFEKRYACG